MKHTTKGKQGQNNIKIVCIFHCNHENTEI